MQLTQGQQQCTLPTQQFVSVAGFCEHHASSEWDMAEYTLLIAITHVVMIWRIGTGVAHAHMGTKSLS